ncbi:hypothetical protein VK91_09230 [Lysinibacillus sp. LK3]|nr:hypothetical protein VK91_09230 [Lysinibacillus sp. LK3]
MAVAHRKASSLQRKSISTFQLTVLFFNTKKAAVLKQNDSFRLGIYPLQTTAILMEVDLIMASNYTYPIF